MPTLLQVSDLHVAFADANGKRRVFALNGASLHLERNTCLGILGESGSGKSTLARALLQLLSQRGRVSAGSILFEGHDLLSLKESQLQKLRGARISMIPQEPGQALNPVLKIGDQIAEVLHAHNDWDWQRCRIEAEHLLVRVRLHIPGRRLFDAYPHQLSGGQQQRVVIAQALSCRPDLVIGDEPTASLDPASATDILQLLREMKNEYGTAMILITHDPSILEGIVDRIAVLYAGRVVEEASADVIFRAPKHPYTRALLACVPSAQDAHLEPTARRFPTIPGTSPDPERQAAGCAFAPRCAERLPHCDTIAPSAVEVESDQRVECHLYGDRIR